MTEFKEGLDDSDDSVEIHLEAYVRWLFDRTLDAVCQTPKTSAVDDEAIKIQASEFAEKFEAIKKIDDQSARFSALSAAAAALELGFYHAGNREVLRALQAERGRKGGQKSVAVRREGMHWKVHARELAEEAVKRDPNLSAGKVADAIWDGWKRADLNRPGRRTIEKFVSRLRTLGTLPQRTGSSQK